MTGAVRPADLSLIEKAALLSGANVWQTRAIPRLGIRSIWMSDGPHGVRKQLADADHLGLGASEPAVCFPTGATLANSWDETLLHRVGAALGREAATRDVDVLLGPGLNIKRSPLGGRGFEYFSEDPELAGRLGAAFVRGVQSEGVAATPKHFAVNSQEFRRLVSDSVVDERTLRELYLTAFEIVVTEAAPWALMSSYNRVNGVHTHENTHLLTDILRGEWGFDGAVVSDWGGADDPVSSVRAGGTIEMPSPGFDSARAVMRAVRGGTLDEADVDDRVGEVLRLVERVSVRGPATALDEGAHQALAREAAAAGAVLLRNAEGLLPLAPGASVALIGAYAEHPRYQGAGSSLITPTRLPSMVDAMTDAAVDAVGYAAGYRLDGAPDAALCTAAADLARRADVAVVVLAVPAADETEGRDRPGLALPPAQVAVLRTVAATGTPVVAVIAGGGAVETPWQGETSALLHAYLGGQAGAEAVWDVLLGRVEPGGRLAETLPREAADDVTAGRFPATGPRAEYREGLHIRYRAHAATGVRPAFPLGFGLGYTTFEYRDLRVTADGATFTLANTGARRGSEVPQLYVRRTAPGRVYRPVLELKGFAKVTLEAGESAEVHLAFGARTFRFFDVETGAWQVESGEYDILVGPDSARHPLTAVHEVVGTVPAGSGRALSAGHDLGEVRHVCDDEFAALRGAPLPPAPTWSPPFDRQTPFDALAASPNLLVRTAVGLLARRVRAGDTGLHPEIEAAFVYYGPLRIVHKMTAGRLTARVTDELAAIANGGGVRAFGRLLRAVAVGARQERRARRAFERAATRRD